jgi:hypothetical protein
MSDETLSETELDQLAIKAAELLQAAAEKLFSDPLNTQ